MKKVITFIIFCAVLFGISFYYFSTTQNDSNNEINQEDLSNEIINNKIDGLKEEIVEQQIEIPEKSDKITKEHVIKQTGWIPSWDFNSGVETIGNHYSEFDSISPVWYEVSANGSLISKENSNSYTLQNLTDLKPIKLIPSIALFDSATLKSVLSTEENYNRHIDSIVSEVITNNYDGIDLDYEMIETSEKESYLSLIKDLSTELHKKDKVLSITVLAKWSDADIYTSLKQTRDAQDWARISKHADEVRIMTYDYNNLSEPNPGPIGPFDWQIQVLNYAITKIPREKIWLGVHLYGYEWAQNSDLKNRSFTYSTTEKVFTEVDIIEQEYNEVLKEGIAVYEFDGTQYTLYYMTQEGVEARRDLAKEYGIAGVAYWKIGRESGLLDL